MAKETKNENEVSATAAGVNESVAQTPPSEGAQRVASSYGDVPAFGQDDEAEVQIALKNLEERRRRNRRNRIVKITVACGVVVVAIAAWAIANAAGSQAESADVPSGAAMEIAPPSPAGVQASGTLHPGSSAVVTPEVSGIVEEVRVAEGQHVEAGDVLLVVKSDEAERGLADARAELDKAQRGVDKAQSSVASAQRDYDDAVDSFNASVDDYNSSLRSAAAAGQSAYDKAYQKAVAAIPSDVSEAKRKELVEAARQEAQLAYDAAYQQAVAADPGTFDHSSYVGGVEAADDVLTTARDALADAQRNYDRAQEQVGKCQVKAPRSGTILSVDAVVGTAVGGAAGGTASGTHSTGEASVLIGDLSTLEVDIEVNEIDVPGVKPGQIAEVTFPAFPDLQEEAEVVSVASAATSASDAAGGGSGGIVTFAVKLVIKQPDDRLKAGMSASVKISTEDEEAVSDASTLSDDGETSGEVAPASGSAS